MKIHIIKYLKVKIHMVTVLTNAIRTDLRAGVPVSYGISDGDKSSILNIKYETVDSKTTGSCKNFLYRHKQPAYRHPF